MKVTSSEAIYETNGEKYLRCTIYADSTPSPLPKPEDVPGYDNTFSFTPDSLLVITGTGDAYLAGEDNAWHKQ